ncbi:hypothetical protein BOO22_15975 [Vibrio cidicii]|nr:hypothetical protein [Vibrio cidicii]
MIWFVGILIFLVGAFLAWYQVNKQQIIKRLRNEREWREFVARRNLSIEQQRELCKMYRLPHFDHE